MFHVLQIPYCLAFANASSILSLLYYSLVRKKKAPKFPSCRRPSIYIYQKFYEMLLNLDRVKQKAFCFTLPVGSVLKADIHFETP